MPLNLSLISPAAYALGQESFNWDEEAHPRGDGGKFTSGGGSATGKPIWETTKA